MKLFLYRLSLTERNQDDLFAPDRLPSRSEFLSQQFARKFSFNHRARVSLQYEFTQEDDEIIAGAICRWISETAEADPTDPFTSVDGGKWRKAAFFLNIEEHQQVFGIEHVAEVGSPSAILAAILKAINKKTDGIPYFIEAAELNIKGSFREAINAYPGPITFVRFKFVVPNPPDVEKETREALKKLGKATGAEEATETLKATKGLKTNSDYFKDAVDYVEDGGGEVAAKSGNEQIYDSTKRVRTADVTDDVEPRGEPIPGLAQFVKSLLRK